MSVRHLDRLLEPRSRRRRSARRTARQRRRDGLAQPARRRLRRPDLRRQPEARDARRRAVPRARRRPAAGARPGGASARRRPRCRRLIDELGRLGTRAAIVMTAGLDAAQKQAMLDAARPHLLRMLGPNCLGLLTPRLGLNASFAHTDALRRRHRLRLAVGRAGHRGARLGASRAASASRTWSRSASAPTSTSATCSTTSPATPHTRSILLYIESIEAPRKFMSAARAAARNKPVIVVKAGRAGNGVQGGGLAHRRARRLRHRLRRRDPPRRHAARRHAAGPVHGGRDAGALRRQPRRRADAS